MIRELLTQEYLKSVDSETNGAERESDRHPDGSTTALKAGHIPPEKLLVETLDVDEFPAFIQIELQNYYLDLDECNHDVAVYRLGK